MAIQNDYPVLDGIAPSWADIGIKLKPTGGSLIEVKDIAALNSSVAVEVGNQRGASGGRVMKRTTGSVSYDGVMNLYRDGFLTLIEALSAVAPVRGAQRVISLVPFLVEVQYTPVGSDRIYHYRLKGCRMLGETDNAAEGTDASQIECPLSVLEKVHVKADGTEVIYL